MPRIYYCPYAPILKMAVTINTMLEHTIHDKCLRCGHSVIEFYMAIRIDDWIYFSDTIAR